MAGVIQSLQAGDARVILLAVSGNVDELVNNHMLPAGLAA